MGAFFQLPMARLLPTLVIDHHLPQCLGERAQASGDPFQHGLRRGVVHLGQDDGARAAVHQGADDAPIEDDLDEISFSVTRNFSGRRFLRPLQDGTHVSKATPAILAATPGPPFLVSLPQDYD